MKAEEVKKRDSVRVPAHVVTDWEQDEEAMMRVQAAQTSHSIMGAKRRQRDHQMEEEEEDAFSGALRLPKRKATFDMSALMVISFCAGDTVSFPCATVRPHCGGQT